MLHLRHLIEIGDDAKGLAFINNNEKLVLPACSNLRFNIIDTSTGFIEKAITLNSPQNITEHRRHSGSHERIGLNTIDEVVESSSYILGVDRQKGIFAVYNLDSNTLIGHFERKLKIGQFISTTCGTKVLQINVEQCANQC